LNEVIYLTKGAESSAQERAAMLQKNVEIMGMQNGVWLSKKGGMPIVQHAESMLKM